MQRRELKETVVEQQIRISKFERQGFTSFPNLSTAAAHTRELDILGVVEPDPSVKKTKKQCEKEREEKEAQERNGYEERKRVERKECATQEKEEHEERGELEEWEREGQEELTEGERRDVREWVELLAGEEVKDSEVESGTPPIPVNSTPSISVSASMWNEKRGPEELPPFSTSGGVFSAENRVDPLMQIIL